MKSRLTRYVLFATVLSGGCDTVGSVVDLRRAQRRLVSELGEDDIAVSLTEDRALTISVVNSPLRALAPEQKDAKARSIALSALVALAPTQHLKSVAVVFVSRESKGLFNTVSDARDLHTFMIEDLERAGAQQQKQRAAEQ